MKSALLICTLLFACSAPIERPPAASVSVEEPDGGSRVPLTEPPTPLPAPIKDAGASTPDAPSRDASLGAPDAGASTPDAALGAPDAGASTPDAGITQPRTTCIHSMMYPSTESSWAVFMTYVEPAGVQGDAYHCPSRAQGEACRDGIFAALGYRPTNNSRLYQCRLAVPDECKPCTGAVNMW